MVDRGHTASWPDFIELFVKAANGEYIIDAHHTPIADHCAKCNIEWDFIIHQETMSEDGEYILRNVLHAPEEVTVGRLNSETNLTAPAREDPLAKLQNYCQFDDAVVGKLEKYYEDDYVMYGYDKFDREKYCGSK